jgi:hypothetical protein
MGWVVSIMPQLRFTPGERTACTHSIGGWVCTRAGLDAEVRGRILCLCQGLNPDLPVIQSIVRHYTDWATPAPKSYLGPVQSMKLVMQLFQPCVYLISLRYKCSPQHPAVEWEPKFHTWTEQHTFYSLIFMYVVWRRVAADILNKEVCGSRQGVVQLGEGSGLQTSSHKTWHLTIHYTGYLA